jgi:spore cortex formation protein SpoVR/YcgB (stage V sporulation)
MNKFNFLVILSICSFFIVACSKENNESLSVKSKKEESVSKIKEPTYPVIDSRFEKMKLVTLEYLTKRQELLKKEKECVLNAINREQIKRCLEEANEERKMVSEEIKNKKKEVKKESVKEPVAGETK